MKSEKKPHGAWQWNPPPIEEIADERTDIRVGKVNVDENPELAEKFGIMSIPTLLVFKEGKLVKSAVGLHDKGGLAEMVK